MPKTISLIAILFIALVILVSLARQIAWSLDAGRRLDSSVETISKLQKQNQDLKNQLSQVQNPDFTEKILRDKLNMAKPNETVVIIPDEIINKILGASKQISEPKISNWQGWLKLFLH